MTRILRVVAWSTLGCVTLLLTLACQAKPKQDLDPAIGAPVQERYQSIRDAQDWMNPYVSVCPPGVVLSVRSVGRVHDRVAVDTLRNALLNLPVVAWPYGRIVALQDCSIGVPGDAEERRVRMQAVESILNGLGLAISRWPS